MLTRDYSSAVVIIISVKVIYRGRIFLLIAYRGYFIQKNQQLTRIIFTETIITPDKEFPFGSLPPCPNELQLQNSSGPVVSRSVV